MEKRIIKKTDAYLDKYKDSIKEWLEENEVTLEGKDVNISDFLQFIYDYERLSITKEDFKKRKRIKNVVPYFDRCNAKRANSEQCTRRKKDKEQFCGTHNKGTPHGIIDNSQKDCDITKIEVWLQEIKGINYYIDGNNNVYKAEDILVNIANPKIIAKYQKNIEGQYSIPELGI
jgi:hypothetical protein